MIHRLRPPSPSHTATRRPAQTESLVNVLVQLERRGVQTFSGTRYTQNRLYLESLKNCLRNRIKLAFHLDTRNLSKSVIIKCIHFLERNG